MICNLCPRQCGAVRTAERGDGLCGMPEGPMVARAALHMWEEPPISGTRGSGTVFFSGCPLGCVFCQNEKISHEHFGKALTLDQLEQVCENLIAQGAHNLNFVTPTHYAHVLRPLLERYRPSAPVVWNTGGYERLETLHSLDGLVDIYLPDLKYLDQTAAQRYSAAPDYPQVAVDAIQEMVRQVGPCQFDENGLMKKGVIIRHLILPGQVDGAKAVMDWVAQTFPKGTVLFSLMSQYTPFYKAAEHGIGRRITTYEYRRVVNYAMDLGLSSGYMQQKSSAKEEYTPSFQLEGLEAFIRHD